MLKEWENFILKESIIYYVTVANQQCSFCFKEITCPDRIVSQMTMSHKKWYSIISVSFIY